MKAEQGPAVFSEDRAYRYTLSRNWGPGKALMWIGLNPSTADESQLDPTLRRVLGYSRAFGYDGFRMTNLFAFRATFPRVMLLQSDPVGPDNDMWLLRVAESCDKIVCAWGAQGKHRDRSSRVVELLSQDHADKLHCFGLTRAGEPKHPLYLPAATPLIPFTR